MKMQETEHESDPETKSTFKADINQFGSCEKDSDCDKKCFPSCQLTKSHATKSLRFDESLQNHQALFDALSNWTATIQLMLRKWFQDDCCEVVSFSATAASHFTAKRLHLFSGFQLHETPVLRPPPPRGGNAVLRWD
ncbi:hypothetical protein YC2023_019474 [Brassica napus]